MTEIFSDKELDILLESAILGGATDDECQEFVSWATNIKIGMAILNKILAGGEIVTVSKN